MRIQSRIFIGFIVILGIGFSSLVYWIVGDLKPQFRKATEEPLVDASRVLASLAATTVKDGSIDAELFRSVFRDAYSRPFCADIYGYLKSCVDYRVYITDASGIVVFDSLGGRDEGKDYSRWNDVKRTLDGGYGARSTRETPDDPSTSVMYVAAPVVSGGRTVGVLSVGKPSASTNQFAEDAKRKIIIGGWITGLCAVLVAMLISWRITAPIKGLTDYARAVRDGQRAEPTGLGGGEVRELGEAFEEMRSALEGKQYVENYIQALTHEIKSPLSAIRGATELLSEDGVPPDQRKRFLANIKDETNRLGVVIERLLLLASLEKMSSLQDVRPIDLSEVASGVKESLYPALKAKGVSLETRGDDGCVFEGDPFLIRQAVSNLVENAVEFSPRDSMITVETRKKDGYVLLHVRDRGPGIPEYATGRVFERFYSLKRPDTGRKSSGLGLCLVREVAELHRGTVELINSPAGGLTATLSIPMHSA